MLGPALQQLLSALSRLPEEKKSPYQTQLQQELEILGNIGNSWKNRISALGQSAWWSNPNRQYNIWVTSAPGARVESTAQADKMIYAGDFRMTVDSGYVLGMLGTPRPPRGEQGVAQVTACDEPNCPWKG
jgi:hypothetical protein